MQHGTTRVSGAMTRRPRGERVETRRVPRLPRPVLLVLALCAALLICQLLLLVAHPLLTQGVGQDLVDFYAGALALRHGLNPYTHAVALGQLLTGIDPQVHPFAYDYPPPFTILVTPLTLLPLDIAYRVLCAVDAVAVATGTALVYRAVRGQFDGGLAAAVAAAVAVALASGAGFLADWYGQATPLLALAAAGTVALTISGRPGWAGAVASVLFLKPQLGLVACAALFLWGGDRARRGLTAGVLALVVISLLAVGPHGCLDFATAIIGDVRQGSRERVHDVDSLALDGVYYQVFSPGWRSPSRSSGRAWVAYCWCGSRTTCTGHARRAAWRSRLSCCSTAWCCPTRTSTMRRC